MAKFKITEDTLRAGCKQLGIKADFTRTTRIIAKMRKAIEQHLATYPSCGAFMCGGCRSDIPSDGFLTACPFCSAKFKQPAPRTKETCYLLAKLTQHEGDLDIEGFGLFSDPTPEMEGHGLWLTVHTVEAATFADAKKEMVSYINSFSSHSVVWKSIKRELCKGRDASYFLAEGSAGQSP